jgi:hypothetical protein
MFGLFVLAVVLNLAVLAMTSRSQIVGSVEFGQSSGLARRIGGKDYGADPTEEELRRLADFLSTWMRVVGLIAANAIWIYMLFHGVR